MLDLVGSGTGNGRLVGLLLTVALLLIGLISPDMVLAHSAEQSIVPVAGNDAAIGLDERLGAKIPLDVVFRDEAGKLVRLGDLVTGPTIILPVYYSCPNVCYRLQWELASVLPQLRLLPGKEYRVVSFSFDPDEQPALAAQYKRVYLAKIHAPFPEDGWRFLTGDAANILRLTAAAGYHFQKQRRDFIHPVASLVVSRDGTIVRYLHGTSFLAKDLTLALIEARDGKVGSAVRGLLSYCFTFDPVGKTYVFNLLRVSATAVIICGGSFLGFLLLAGRKKRSKPSG